MRRPSPFRALRSVLPTLLVLAATFAPGARAAAPQPAPGSAEPLPNDFVLARIGERRVTVFDFRERFYASDINFRPAQDSLGRATFLNSMVQKDVLGQVALKAGYSLGFEDRAELRSFRNQIISNRLFETTVNRPSRLSADSIEKVASFYRRRIRVRLLSFTTRQEAEFQRRQLLSGRLSWAAASKKYAAQGDSLSEGLTPFVNFALLPFDVAIQVWPLRVGEMSNVIAGGSDYFVVRIADETYPGGREVTYTDRKLARMALRALERSQNRREIIDEARQGMAIVYDTTAIVWAGSHFRDVRKHNNNGGFGLSMDIDATVPEFSPEDTSRVLVTSKDGKYTLGRLLKEWTDLQPMMRPTIVTFEQMADFIDSGVLEHRLVEIAEQRGLGNDSLAVVLVNRKHEEIVVTHMVQDSVLTPINVTRAEREAYYKSHLRGFVTWAQVRYVMLERKSQAAADSALKRLRSGMPPELLVAQDHARGIAASDTATLSENDASPFRRTLLEELHPGQSTIVTTTRGTFYVVKSISREEGHQLEFGQVEGVIDESLRNIKGDAALKAFIARHSKDFVIESHPEVLMRVPLTDPYTDDMFN